MAGKEYGDEQGQMPRAIAASVVLHVVVLLLLMVLPVSEPTVAEEPEEEIITFTFEPEPEPEPQQEALSDLFKVTGTPPEEPTDSTPPPAVLGDPMVEPLEGEQPDAALQPPSPPVPEENTAEQPEEIDPEENEPNDAEQPEEIPEETPEEPQEVEEPAPDKEEQMEQQMEWPEEETGQVEMIQEPREKKLDVRSAVNRAVRTAMTRPQQPSAGRPTDGAGSPQGMEIPELERLPDSGFSAGNLQFESSDFDWSDYARSIYVAIWRAWHNRLHATTDEFERWAFSQANWMLDHQLQIRFTIQRNGQVTGIMVEAGSDCEPLDQATIDALHEVVLPPLPKEFPREQETIHGRFLAQGDIRILRQNLDYMKARGMF